MPTDGIHLDFKVEQSFMLGEMDDQFLRGVIMVDESLQVTSFTLLLVIVKYLISDLPYFFAYKMEC